MISSLAVVIDVLVARLEDPSVAESLAGFPFHPEEANHPGLYAWWADEAGLAMLSAPFPVVLPSLIYAGQAGATTTVASTVRAATLRTRIGSNHIRGNIGSSTFRRTITAILREPLPLVVAPSGRLDSESNRKVSEWMGDHLRVGIAPVTDRATLADIERGVLERLDPPLNLMGMRPSDVRTKLRELRSDLTAAPASMDS
jgi:hypothetical protein